MIHRHMDTIKLSDAIEKGFKERWQSTKSGVRTRTRLLQFMRVVGDIQLRDIDEALIIGFKAKLREKGLSNATINRSLANLKTVGKQNL